MLAVELTPEHPVGRLGELGERAEDAGFDTVFVSSHYFNRDPFVALDRVARRTESVRVGPGVVNPYEYHPVTLASRVASLDEASGGRAVFGIGAGDPSSLRSLGLDDERGLRSVLESFRVARRLWAGERVDHDGSFEARDADLKFDPPEGDDIPVYVGGEGPGMCRMAATHADGLLFNGSHPDDLAWAREQVADGLAERSDDPAPDGPADPGAFELVAYASVSVAADPDAARAAARPAVAFIAAGAAPPVLDRHGLDRERAAEIGAASSAGAFDRAYGLVTPAMVAAFCAAGTPEAVADRLAALREHADGLVVGSPVGPDLEVAIARAGTVAPRREGPR
jgi:5,10-methylenetetrahydromethanopterin reductase